MKHLRDLQTHRTPYQSDAQRVTQAGEHLAAMWVAETPHDLQQHMWLAVIYLTAVGGNPEGIIATLDGSLQAMADHDDCKNDKNGMVTLLSLGYPPLKRMTLRARLGRLSEVVHQEM